MYPAFIHTQTTARNIDHAAIKTYQIPSLILMEHAALKSAEIIEQIANTNQSICILCGPGNNGADGLAIARLLQPKYPNLYVVVPEIKKMSEDEKIQFQMIQNLKIPFSQNLPNVTYDIYIDCLFGNGLSRDITGFYKTMIQNVNTSHSTIISIDMPSGIDSTMGNVLGCAIHADYTISLDCYKQGQWLNEGKNHCGKLYLVDIGIPQILHQLPNHQYLNIYSLTYSPSTNTYGRDKQPLVSPFIYLTDRPYNVYSLFVHHLQNIFCIANCFIYFKSIHSISNTIINSFFHCFSVSHVIRLDNRIIQCSKTTSPITCKFHQCKMSFIFFIRYFN